MYLQIIREFRDTYDTEDNFLGLFESLYVPRIIEYCALTKPQLLERIKDIEDGKLKYKFLKTFIPRSIN